MNTYAIYQKQAFETAKPEDILLKLYEGAILRLKKAKQNWDLGSQGNVFEKINQAVKIITELDNTLDRENGDAQIVSELEALYHFMVRELNFCVLRQDYDRLQPVLDILENLYNGWQDAAQQVKQSNKYRSRAAAV